MTEDNLSKDTIDRIYRTRVNQLLADGLKVMLNGKDLTIYSPATKESITIPISKRNLQFLEMKFPALRQS